jgi:hypothetical protein
MGVAWTFLRGGAIMVEGVIVGGVEWIGLVVARLGGGMGEVGTKVAGRTTMGESVLRMGEGVGVVRADDRVGA